MRTTLSKRDRENVISLLSGIATDDTISIVNAGQRILKNHPDLLDDLEPHHRNWWKGDQ